MKGDRDPRGKQNRNRGGRHLARACEVEAGPVPLPPPTHDCGRAKWKSRVAGDWLSEAPFRGLMYWRLVSWKRLGK